MSLDVTLSAVRRTVVYTDNITHNLGDMARAVGLYTLLWRPEEVPDIQYAGDLIPHLQKGLQQLHSDPERYRALNPENGWGSYEGLCEFVERYLQACIDNPNAEISVSR